MNQVIFFSKSCFFILLSVGISQEIFAKKKSESDQNKLKVLEAVENKYAQIQTFQSQVQKTVILKVLQRETVHTGRLRIKKPGRLRMDFKSPVKSILLINNDGTWHTQYPDTPEFDDKIRVVKTKTKSVLQTALLSILEGGEILKHFNLSKSEKKDSSHIFKLTPKKEVDILHQLEVEVNALFFVTRVTYWDELQNQTTLKFHQISVNQNIEDDVFQFKKPPKAEIVEN